MKKIAQIFLLIFSMGILCARAQNAALSSGGNASGSGGSSSYSVGQISCLSASSSSGFSNEGVQQPYEIFVTGIEKNDAISLSMTAYPNPANSTLNLKVENQDTKDLFLQLFTLEGKQLVKQNIISTLTTLPLQVLTSGTYLLSISNTKTTIKSFTIIKN